MRTLVAACLIAVLVAAGCGEDEDEGASAPQVADLTVEVDRDGPDDAEEAAEAQVQCATREDSDLCEFVESLSPDDFAPTQADEACTQQFGGPETATVQGTLHGTAIDASFSRQNGCEIARWDRVAELLAAPASG